MFSGLSPLKLSSARALRMITLHPLPSLLTASFYRFFEFSLEGVRGASSGEDVIIRKSVKGHRMSKATINDRI